MPNIIVEDFLRQHGRDLESLEFCYSKDSNINSPELFNTAKLRVLFVFLSPGITRSVSNTFTVLHHYLRKTMGDDIFVDFCYLPTQKDLKIYQKQGMSFLFGAASHEMWKDFDVVCISISILPEIWNVPSIFWQNSIPLAYQDRMADPTIPLMLTGGTCSTFLDCAYGRVGDDPSKTTLMDGVNIGHAEAGLDKILRVAIDMKGQDKREVLKKMCEASPHFFVPGEVTYDYELNKDHGYILKGWTPNEGFPEGASLGHIPRSMDHPGFDLKVMNMNGTAVTSADIDISSGCSGGGGCNFCQEGLIGGPFLERSLDRIKEMMVSVRLNSAPNGVSFYSYNMPYFSKLMDLLCLSAERFGQFSMINLRVDSIAPRAHVFEATKLLGLRRMSAAVEGMGETIRNGFLNKSLALHQWQEFARHVFAARLAEVKTGMIYTGHETEEDFAEFIAEVDSILAIRESMQVNTSLRFTFTPLVFYPHTPLQRMRKVTSQDNLLGRKRLSPVLQALKARGCRSKVNGRSRSTFMEQFLLTFGRIGTKYLVQVATEPPYYGSISKNKEEELLHAFENDGIDPANFLNEIPLDHKLWWDNIGVYKAGYQAKFDERMKHPLREIAPMRPCTVSPANFSPGTEKAKETGRTATCHNCGCCPTPELKKEVLFRKIGSTNKLEDFKSILSRSQANYRTPFELFIKPEAFFYSATTAVHYVVSRILQDNPALEPIYHMLDKNNLSWVTSNEQRDWFTGRVVGQMLWKAPPQFLPGMLERVNARLSLTKLLAVHPTLTKGKLVQLDNYNLYDVHMGGVSADIIRAGFSSFDGTTEVAAKSQGSDLELEPYYMEESPSVFVKDVSGGSRSIIALPLRVNPIFFLKTITGLGYQQIMRITNVSCLYTLRNTNGVCKVCGQPAVESITGKPAPGLCMSCLGKLVLSK